ncbi:hypothetical protein RvY_08548-2 [Ramazzottius varieornatus]|uniref:Uncharacterized protein n=1 Tax=Ramazzottius varieornatus TaxID=947166 RepID=A0A1D1V672_RAMVA|nr:hypothetical protein RvY_08548-2 [Ramazzottius varieornatus]
MRRHSYHIRLLNMKYALVVIMSLSISFLIVVLLLAFFDYKVTQVVGFSVPSNNDLATQVTGATNLYGLLDVLSNIPPPGSLQATGYQVTNVPPAPYSDKPYIVTPPSVVLTPQTYYIPTAPPALPYPNVSAYAVGPDTSSYGSSGDTYAYQSKVTASPYTTPSVIYGTNSYVSPAVGYGYQNKVTGGSYGTATSDTDYRKPHIDPELIVTGPNPAYPSYPGSSYSNQLSYNVGNVYNPIPVRPSYTSVTPLYTNTPPSTITFIPAPGAVLTNANCNHYKCQNDYKNIIGNGGKYTPAVLPGLASTFVGNTDEYTYDNHGQPPPIPFPPIPPPVQFGSGAYNPPLNIGLNAGINSGSFGLGSIGPGIGSGFGGPFPGGFNNGFPGSFRPGAGQPPLGLFRPPFGVGNGVGPGLGFTTAKPYQGGGTFPLITPDYSSSSHPNNQYSSNSDYGNSDYSSGQKYGTDSYNKGVGVGLASGTPYSDNHGGVALAYNGYGGSYYNKGTDYDQSSILSRPDNYGRLPSSGPLFPPANGGYQPPFPQRGIVDGGYGAGQYGSGGYQTRGNQVDIRGLGTALAGLTSGDGLSTPLAQQFPIVPNGLVNGPGSAQFQPISESDAVLALALNAILEDRNRPRQSTITEQLVSDVLRSRMANASATTPAGQLQSRRENTADLWRQFLTSAVAFVSKRLNDNA